MSIKRCFTLKNKTIIRSTLSKGRSYQKKGLIAKVTHHENVGGVLVFVRKKQVSLAVKRNRIKRIVLNTYRELMPEGLANKNVVVFFKHVPSMEKLRPLSQALFEKIAKDLP